MPGQVNGYDVASAWWSEGYRGCWVFALGTNDTANVSVGSSVGLMGRVEQMMSAAHGEPVLWVNARTMLSGGPWSEANMQAWNNTLLQACARYPNMRVLDWASVANPGWFMLGRDSLHLGRLRRPGPGDRGRASQGVPPRRPQQRLRRALTATGWPYRPPCRPVPYLANYNT